MKNKFYLSAMLAVLLTFSFMGCDFWDDEETAPNAPTGISANAVSSSSITVSWNAANSATGYKVYRGTDSSGPFTVISTLTQRSFTDTGLTANTTYHYRITASNSIGESSMSAIASATTGISNVTPTATIAVGQLHEGDLPGAVGVTEYIRVTLAAGIPYKIDFYDYYNYESEYYTSIEVGLIRESTGLFVFEYESRHPGAVFEYTVPAGAGGNYLVAVRKIYRPEASFYDLRIEVNFDTTIAVGDWHEGELPGAVGVTQYLRIQLTGDTDYKIEFDDYYYTSDSGYTSIEVGLIRESTGLFVFNYESLHPQANFEYTVPAGAGGYYLVAVRKIGRPEAEFYDLRIVVNFIVDANIDVGLDYYPGEIPGAIGTEQLLGVTLNAGTWYIIEWEDSDSKDGEIGFADIEVGLIRAATGELVQNFVDYGNTFDYTVPAGEGGLYVIVVRKIWRDDGEYYDLRIRVSAG